LHWHCCFALLHLLHHLQKQARQGVVAAARAAMVAVVAMAAIQEGKVAMAAMVVMAVAVAMAAMAEMEGTGEQVEVMVEMEGMANRNKSITSYFSEINHEFKEIIVASFVKPVRSFSHTTGGRRPY
jgi:hypothetical protein